MKRILILINTAIMVSSAAAAPPEPLPDTPDFSDVSVHDPSLIRVDDEFYVFGSHLASAGTMDWRHWVQFTTDGAIDAGNALVPDPATTFAEAIAWTQSNQAFWAPDVIQLGDGRFYYYYCIGRLDQPVAALGVAVSDDILGPYEHDTIILRSGHYLHGQTLPDGTPYDPTIHPNAVDPDVFFDQEGRLWMLYGSYSGGLFILEMDPATGLPLPGQGYGTHITGGNHARIEGGFVVYSPESDYYYLTMSFGGLAANGGYNIRVGRSRNPDGPYMDAEGNDLADAKGAPGTLFDDESIEPYGVKIMGNWQFLAADGEPSQSTTGYVSPGHNSAYYDPDTGRYFLVFHTRFADSGEFHQVRVHQMYLNDQDWLVAAPHRYAGETLTPRHRHQVAGDYKVIVHGKDISPVVKTSELVTLGHNGAITGAMTGSWSFSGTNDIDIVIGGISYDGIFSTQWDDDQGAWVQAFSALSGDGVALWGSRVVTANHPAREVRLPDIRPVYGEVFEMALPEPDGRPGNAYTWSVVEGPEGLVVERSTGVLGWQPGLLDVGVDQPVTIRALNTTSGLTIEAGDPDEVWYRFDARASSPTVVERREFAFDAPAGEGIQDTIGQFTGLTARLPGTGTAHPTPLDPNLLLDPVDGVLNLSSTQSDFNGGFGVEMASMPGLALADLGLTGSEDFAVKVVIRPLPPLEFIDQAGLYVGADHRWLTRAGTIVFGAPEYFSTNTFDGFDVDGRFLGFGFDGGDGMTVTISRQDWQWRHFIDGVEWNPTFTPWFLDGRADLHAGFYAVTPLNGNVKTVAVESFTAVVATEEPCPDSPGAEDFGCAE